MIPVISQSTNLKVSCSISPTPSPPNRTLKQQHPSSSTLKFLSKSGKLDEALHLLQSSSSLTDQDIVESYSLLLHACISSKSLQHGQKLHSILTGSSPTLLNNPTLTSKLITLYSVCGHVDEARRVFDDILDEAHVAESVWVSMAIGYSRNGYPKQALRIYHDMLHRFIEVGNFAFSMALKACTDLSDFRFGRSIHAQIIKSIHEPDQVVNNALLKLYAKCGSLEDAFKVFDKMPERNVASWNSLISSFTTGEENLFESLNVFRRMQKEGIGFSWITLTTILPICARLTSLLNGKEIHSQIIKSTRKPDIPVQNSLMDMYSKCGAIDYSRRLFDRMQSKDLTSWNIILSGNAMNGQMEEAMELYEKMVKSSGFKPDGVTFIALLAGCSHSGLKEIGQKLFSEMEFEYAVSPTQEHYACLVDILGRAGKIVEALKIVKDMPMKPRGSVYGSLLNSCRLHGNVSAAEVIVKDLFLIEPDNAGNYVMLSNIYANAGMWDLVKKVRDLMERRGVRKEVGCSWVQIRTRLQTFVAGGGFKFRNSEEFKRVWNELKDAMEHEGYVARTSCVLHNVDEETKEMWACGHSERTALVYALIHTGPSMPIRITKNLRVCSDCHYWIKVVSRITERLIVLRDTNRFHHFKDGVCSCKDYW